jgi:hypothetical protein
MKKPPNFIDLKDKLEGMRNGIPTRTTSTSGTASVDDYAGSINNGVVEQLLRSKLYSLKGFQKPLDTVRAAVELVLQDVRTHYLNAITEWVILESKEFKTTDNLNEYVFHIRYRRPYDLQYYQLKFRL